MAGSDFESIIKELKAKVYHPVYFLCGEEPYFIDYISDYITDNVLDDSQKDFNLTVVYGKEIKTEQIVEMASRYPMMAEKNIIIIKEAQELKFDDRIEEYLKKPVESTILVFCYKHKKLDKRKKLFGAIKKNSVFFEGKKIFESNIAGWISNFLRKKKLGINQQASQLLADYLGNDLSKIANELEKLHLILEKGKTIDLEDIEKHIGISRQYNIFELQKALSFKNIKKTTQIYNYFSSDPKTHPLPLLTSFLYGYFSKLHAIYYGKKDLKIAMKEMGIQYFLENEYRRALNNYGNKLNQVMSLLKEYDLKSKGINSSGVPETELTKEFLFRIVSL